MLAVQTKMLSRRYGTRTAVDSISMSVPQGAVYGFLGRNGAGKTTTLRMLLGLLKPSSGSASICGIDILADRKSAARKFGALLEAHGFYTNLSGRENLNLTSMYLGLPETEVDRVLEIVDMTVESRRRVAEFSLGMRQRLGLARAMLGAPPVLVLDEPTNGLDPDGIADMRRFLGALPELTGATVLLSSHLLHEIEQTASHIGILHQGRLLLEGSLAAIKARQAPQLELRVGDAARAVQVLSSKGAGITAYRDELTVCLRQGADPDQAAADLTRALVAEGVDVFAVAPRARSLENIYADVCSTGSVSPSHMSAHPRETV